jgi:hypothetical protein
MFSFVAKACLVSFMRLRYPDAHVEVRAHAIDCRRPAGRIVARALLASPS